MTAPSAALRMGARVLTNRGLAIVTQVDRHGVHLRDSAGATRFTAYSQLEAVNVTAGGVQGIHASMRPWWDCLDPNTQADVDFKDETLNEVHTGFRSGFAELAQPGEPFYPFGPSFGVSLSQRMKAMSQLISFERSVDRQQMRRVNDGEVTRVGVAARTLHDWDKDRTAHGRRGLVDGRKTRGKQGFEALTPAFRSIAEEILAEFDGTVSGVNLHEIERRIRVRMKQDGVTNPHLPERLMQEFLSFHYRSLGTTTRAHKSRAQRAVSSHESHPAQHPSQVCTDITRADNLCYDDLQERPISVELGTLLSLSTRVVVAARIFPRSANGVDVGLLLYDAMRQFSMLIDGTKIDDFRWCGIPESLDLTGNPVHTGRRPALKPDRQIQGVHHLPGFIPTALRSDHGSIFVGQHFRALCREFGITLMLSRGKKPTDNPHVERLHETYQRAYQQLPGFKGRAVYERGSWVGMAADEPLCTPNELLTHLHRFIAIDYHRQPHDGLTLPGAPGIRLTPLEMWDAQMDAVGRLVIPQHPDLLYQFLPIRWLRPGHAGVEFKNLTYDAVVLEDFRTVRDGSFRAKDNAIPFHYDPRDVTRLWFRHPDTDRIHEIPWRGRHLIHAPLVDVVRDRALARIRERGGNRVLNRTTVMRQLIDEIGELTTSPSSDEWRTKMSAARLRWDQAQTDHAEVAEAHRVLEAHAAQGLPRIPTDDPAEEPKHGSGTVLDFEEPWPDYGAEMG